MGLKNHFEIMAQYNQRINSQLFSTAMELKYVELERNMGAFFDSVIGTLNHIFIGDIIWLSRFKDHSDKYTALLSLEQNPAPNALNDILFTDINDLWKSRIELDETIIRWLSEAGESDFQKDFLYENTKGLEFRKNFGEVVSHFFNHQTHHRGQVSTLLKQLGKDIGVTDLIVDIPDSQRST